MELTQGREELAHPAEFQNRTLKVHARLTFVRAEEPILEEEGLALEEIGEEMVKL